MLSSVHSTPPLALTSFSNSSHSLLESEGSSYHSIGEDDGKKDHVKALLAKIESKPPEWHHFADVGIDTARAPGSPEGVSFRSLMKEEEVVKQLSGLGRDDFVAVQQRLINAVQSRVGKGARDNTSPRLLAKRKVDGDQILSPTQGFGQNFKTLSGTIKAERFPIGTDSLRNSPRHPVIPSLLVPFLQLLSRF